MAEEERSIEDRKLAAASDKVLALAEDGVYALVGMLLAITAGVVLVAVAWHLAHDVGDGVGEAVLDALDGLLTVFILLELLAGLRATLTERKLVAEPFLIVGIIASIRGIIIVGLEAREKKAAEFDDAMTEILVLGALVLVLAVASWLVRRKEREPEEEEI
jgi:uncharacterized membrane protein (DUF373 family)